MAHGSYDLKDHHRGPIRFYCPLCHRWSQQHRDKLVEQFGADQSMPDLLTKVQPCGKANTYGDRCKLIYWDAMCDRDRLAAQGKGEMPPTWRDRILPPWWDSIRDICENLNRPRNAPERYVSYYESKDLRR